MSLSAFKEKILREATADAEKIAHKNALVVEEERSRTAQELRALEEAIVTAAEQEAESTTRSIHQRAQLAGRSLVLTAKQEELMRTKELFLDSLLKMSDADKKKMHEALRKLVPQEKGTIVPATDGIGFVFQAKGVEMNLTLSYLVDQIFWKYRSELVKELFS